MSAETAPIIAIRALLEADTRPEREAARVMAKAALSGAGFVLWRGSQDSRTPGYIFDAFEDRAACEKAMSRTVWATMEAGRGRDVADACKIHGFEIFEVPPADDVAKASRLGELAATWSASTTVDQFESVRAGLRDMWPSLRMRLRPNGSQIIAEDAHGAAFAEFYLKPYRSREHSPDLLALAVAGLDGLNAAASRGVAHV